LTLDFRLFSSTFVLPAAHFIDYLVIRRIMQVLPFVIPLTLGFRKAVLVEATAAAAEVLQVMVVVVAFLCECHIFVRGRQKTKLRRHCTTDSQQFGAKIA
jgi:hypothetical protein